MGNEHQESVPKEQVQVVELTSKKYKKHLLLAFVLLLFGVMFSVNGKIFGPLLIFVSIVWFLLTKFRIWWNHG